MDVLVFDLSSNAVLFFLLFLDLDFDLSILFSLISLISLTTIFLISFASLKFYFPSFGLLPGTCRLLIEGLLFLIECFFLVLDSHLMR